MQFSWDAYLQVYEARLFRLSKKGGIASAEEAIDFQKKKFALNRYFGIYSQSSDNSVNSSMGTMDDGRKRDVGTNILVNLLDMKFNLYCISVCY